MSNLVWELNNWDKIIQDAGGGNDDRRTTATVKAAQKLVFSIVNLQQAIFSFQRKTAPRLDQLRESIDKFNESSTKLYKIYLWLTGIIALAAIINALLILFKR